MLWLAVFERTVGPIARWYTFPVVSATVWTCAVASFHVTMTMFRSPAVWAAVYGAATLVDDDVSARLLPWTKSTPGACVSTPRAPARTSSAAIGTERKVRRRMGKCAMRGAAARANSRKGIGVV